MPKIIPATKAKDWTLFRTLFGLLFGIAVAVWVRTVSWWYELLTPMWKLFFINPNSSLSSTVLDAHFVLTLYLLLPLLGTVAGRATSMVAQIRGTNFPGADLTHANVQGATLKNADFSQATLEQVNLAEADLSGAIMPDGTVFKQKTSV